MNTTGSIIGGDSSAFRNFISGHDKGYGIGIGGYFSISTQIKNNYIGTDKDAAHALGNAFGILISSSTNGAASNTVVTGNIIAGSTQAGIRLAHGASENRIFYNFIGTDAALNQTIPNKGVGIVIDDSPNNQIGIPEDLPGMLPGNIIAFTQKGSDPNADAAGHGILITGANAKGNQVQANVIRQNKGEGVKISGGASENIVGAAVQSHGNAIYGNLDGVDITGAGTSKNVLIGNRIGISESGTPSGNLGSGVIIEGGASNDYVGFVLPNPFGLFGAAAAPNYISANQLQGVFIGDQAQRQFGRGQLHRHGPWRRQSGRLWQPQCWHHHNARQPQHHRRRGRWGRQRNRGWQRDRRKRRRSCDQRSRRERELRARESDFR